MIIQFPSRPLVVTNYGRTEPCYVIILPVVRIERCPEVLLQSDDPRERRRGTKAAEALAAGQVVEYIPCR